MSLENPTLLDKSITIFKGWPIAVRIALPLVLLLVIVGSVLWGIDKVSTWREGRKVDKLKANANALLSNVATIETQVANLKITQAQQLQQANDQIQQFQTEVNASVQDRTESNKALANVAAARNSNEVNVSVDALKSKLDKLDSQQ